jgi:hypothetical protein
MPVVLDTQEAVIRRIAVRSHPWANSSSDPHLGKTPPQNRAGGVAQGIGPELFGFFFFPKTKTYPEFIYK